jgi:hypothetical protein
MDDIVRQALARWPNVPDCFGWLGLDARGDWFLRDEVAQASGGFASGRSQAKGSAIRHTKLLEFIGRNYDADADGRWYFQNGPQRVYVELELTPWVLRVAPDGSVQTHTGQPFLPTACLVDESGRLYLQADKAASAWVGVVHSQDMVHAVEAVEAGIWSPEPLLSDDLPTRFGYVSSPQQAHAAKTSQALQQPAEG